MTLPHASPSAHGVDARGVVAFVDAASDAGIELHSLAVARHGHQLAAGWWAPYGPDRLHLAYSLSKSVTATAVATLVDRGELALDDRIVDRLPLDGIDVDPRWAAVQVQHCLSMTVGHTDDPIGRAFDRVAAGPRPLGLLAASMLEGPGAEPGSVFCYNQIATYVLSRIVAHVTGHHLLDVLRDRVLDPLGIGELLWHRCPEGFELGFSGCHLRTGDIVELAQLWLARGERDGTRLLPASWFDVATLPYLGAGPASNDWDRGYGFSYWMGRHGYRGDGAFGQYAVVLPDRDAAIAITSEQEDMQATLDLVWEHVWPALDRPGSAAADAELAERLSSLAIAPLGGGDATPADPGAEAATFVVAPGSHLPPSYRLTVVPAGATSALTFSLDGEHTTIPVGDGHWADGALVLGRGMIPTVASGGWHGNRFEAAVRMIETPHTLHVTADRRTGQATATWRLVPLTGPDPAALAVRPRTDHARTS